jgi:hypothetical protein
MVKAVTIAATHNSPIAANTATPVIGLANDPGSGKATCGVTLNLGAPQSDSKLAVAVLINPPNRSRVATTSNLFILGN